MTQGEIERLKILYKTEKNCEKIAEKMDYCTVTIQNTVNLLISMGELERKKVNRGRPKTKVDKPKVKKVTVIDEEPLVGVRCTKAVSKKCKYGLGYDEGSNLCNYILITGNRRPCLGRACTCFEERKKK